MYNDDMEDMEYIEAVVSAEYQGERLDVFLTEYLADYFDAISRSYVQKLIKDGLVTRKGKVVKANEKVKEKRYTMFAEKGVRDIAGYNRQAKAEGEDKLPKIVIIIDELADLMLAARDSVEDAICRIAQKARACGIHLVVATQRPSVDVITGLIKANIPSRIAFKVASQVDSRIILDNAGGAGADKLLGRGDMLFLPVGSIKPIRVQGAFVSDAEVEAVVDYLKKSCEAEYDMEVVKEVENTQSAEGTRNTALEEDELLPQAVQIAIEMKQISASYLQRKLGIGYNRAARIIDQMEERGYISCKDGSNPRMVLIDKFPEELQGR